MYTIKKTFPKSFENFPEECQRYYIYNIMYYGLHFEVEPIFLEII